MRLLLLRHAKSERPELGQRDHDRKLNRRGRDDAPKIGAYMARHGLLPDLVIVSTARRTRETWERIARELSAVPRVTFDPRLFHGGPDVILTVVKETGSAAAAIMVIAHNPGLHDTSRLLIASGDVEAREQLNEALPTSGLVVIDFPGKTWRNVQPQGGRLERFVSPRMLEGTTD